MLIFKTISEVQNYLRASKKTIGFVPTMGALHAGHLSLIEHSRQENELTVCSIFVNPTQFTNAEDLKKYPRTLETDCEMLEKAACDIVFAPSAEEMYPTLPALKMNFGKLERVMEGKFRKGHFNGVGIVVAKLFHIVQPNRAYFGQKDFQQVAIIRQMVKDLSFDLTLLSCPIIREIDGLAMSSRNTRLTAEERKIAPQIYQALLLAKQQLLDKQSISATKRTIHQYFAAFPTFKFEYFEIVDVHTLLPLKKNIQGQEKALCIAIFLGNVRLIDNLIVS